MKFSRTVSCDVDGAAKTLEGKCICGWSHCDFIRNQFRANLPADHVWKGLPVEVKQFNAQKVITPRARIMLRNLALQAGIYHHLKIHGDQQTDLKFRVAKHHFPICHAMKKLMK